MISFDCPQCGKAFMLPNREAGREKTCAECAASFVVPEPTPLTRTSRSRRFVPLVFCSLIAAALLGLWAFNAGRPARIRSRFADQLHHHSSRWQGIEWLECDPARDRFKVSVYYSSEHGTYHFAANGTQGSGPTLVRVNPPHWLVYARYVGGVEESYEYRGGDTEERTELQTLAGDVGEALKQALR
jgi:hypothetical protein